MQMRPYEVDPVHMNMNLCRACADNHIDLASR